MSENFKQTISITKVGLCALFAKKSTNPLFRPFYSFINPCWNVSNPGLATSRASRAASEQPSLGSKGLELAAVHSCVHSCVHSDVHYGAHPSCILTYILTCIPPVFFNCKIQNSLWATRFLIGWIMVLNLLHFIESIIWASNYLSTWWDGKVYCDIGVRVKMMFILGVPGAFVGIYRFLGDIFDPNSSKRDLRQGLFKRNLIHSFLSFILPLLFAASGFLFEVSRYHIIGVRGCTADISVSVPSFVIHWMWNPILCLIAGAYNCNYLPILPTKEHSPLHLTLVGPSQTP